MKEFDHPAMFPEELPRRLMKLFSYKNDIVLDPFNGAGTTTLVAAKYGRRFIGIDVSRAILRYGNPAPGGGNRLSGTGASLRGISEVRE